MRPCARTYIHTPEECADMIVRSGLFPEMDYDNLLFEIRYGAYEGIYVEGEYYCDTRESIRSICDSRDSFCLMCGKVESKSVYTPPSYDARISYLMINDRVKCDEIVPYLPDDFDPTCKDCARSINDFMESRCDEMKYPSHDELELLFTEWLLTRVRRLKNVVARQNTTSGISPLQ